MGSYEQIKCFASLPRTTRGKALVLNGDPKGKNMLYTNGNSVIIREIENPAMSDIYTEHSTQTTCAAYSPSGFYIASGDMAGKVRVWDTINKEHILKNEYQPFAGEIKDIAWSGDSQRLAAGGHGNQKYSHVFTADSGNSLGELIGHSADVNNISFRPERPFRLVSASEDNSLCFYEGPPFKFKVALKDHTNFVNVVRYSPKGEVFISGSADKKCYIYDGKTAEKIGELGSPTAHNGGVYALSFNSDGSQVLTVSGDKTARIFKVPSGELVQTFEMGKAVEDMQVGCLWQGDNILTVSLSGFINYLDLNNPSTPRRILKGHNKPITALALSDGTIYSAAGAQDSHVNHWDAETGENDRFTGTSHKNQIQDMVIANGELVTVGMDDIIMFSNVGSKQFGVSQGLESMPKAVSASSKFVVVACIKHVAVFQNKTKCFSQAVPYEPCSVAIHPSQPLVAICGAADKKIHLYSINEGNGSLQETQAIDNTGMACDVMFSPNGEYLATAGADRYVRCFKLPDYQLVFSDPTHTARVNCIDWSPDSSLFATGSLDQSIGVWKPTGSHSDRSLVIKAAHKLSHPTRVRWLNNNTIVSAGHDSNIKQWRVQF
ncbi:actin-interacting protein 1-like [Ostrea edulis]|uniref:actin-interacting protein 1-like n=1 Tax=Ostrea edulis TaxID=37623 RepID=UPI0020943B07|nr:actin-interacting protein 1-like [Ostrea edulis]